MLADQYGNLIGPANPSGMAVDGFGRARSSLPFTLFDSSHRYQENGKSSTANSAGGTYAFSANTSTIDCHVTTANNAYVYRETNRVFAYQPGKSLQVFMTFVMNPAKTNLRQRIGYFNVDNGIFLERSDGVFFVKRSKATGTAQDTRIAQADWNVDPLDGSGPSGVSLNLDHPQIFFIDVEWLGVGSVRCGFVINGQLIHCHSFHHANQSSAPKGAYMQTACLPLRMEIQNTGETSSNSVYKQVCASVISEGGYELRGKQRTVSTGILTTDLINMPTAGTFVPVISARLKTDRLDAIAVLKNLSLLGVGNNTRIEYRLVKGATLTGNTTFVSAGTDSCIEYNKGATGYSGGEELVSGFSAITNQSQSSVTLSDGAFDFQFERNGIANTATIYTLVATGAANGDDVAGGLDWEEIT